MCNQDNKQIIMENSHIDELALLLYCNTAGLEIDEKVTGNISTNALIMFQSICIYLSKKEQENVLRNYADKMQQELLEYEEWYQGIHGETPGLDWNEQYTCPNCSEPFDGHHCESCGYTEIFY